MAITIEPSLEELAERANSEHELVLQAAGNLVHHAIAAGRALRSVRDQIPPGEWLSWTTKNVRFGRDNIVAYIRLAHYAEIVQDAPSIRVARQMLIGLPEAFPRIDPRTPEPDWWVTARRMKEAGASRNEISRVLGVSRASATYALADDDFRRRLNAKNGKRVLEYKRKRAQERRMRDRAERDATARKASGGISDAYGLIRRTAQVLDGLSETGSTPDIRNLAREALRHLYHAEDAVIAAARMATQA